jgi:hypothetical protein
LYFITEGSVGGHIPMEDRHSTETGSQGGMVEGLDQVE